MTEPRKRRRAPRRHELGITLEEYEHLLELQGGGCGICGAEPKTRRLDVDHDHGTGEIRGLLCHTCNRRLRGRVTVEWLLYAIAYLRRVSWLGEQLERFRRGER